MKKLAVVLLLVPSLAYADDPPAGDPPPPADPAVPPPAEPATPPAPTPPPPPVEERPPGTGSLDRAAIEKIVDERAALRKHTSGKDGGFFITSEDGKSQLRVGGILQYDGRFFVDDNPQLVDQFAFRSIRPDLQATLDDHYDFRLLPDFAGGKLVVQEAYADVRYLPELKIRAGKMKVPFGLERLQAEVATTFVERGFPTQLSPNRDLGVQIFGDLGGKLVEYELGVFNGVADGQSGDGDVGRKKEVAARVFVTPLKGLGFGGAATYGYKLGTAASPDVAGFKTQGQNAFLSPVATMDNTTIADGRHWRATGQGYYYNGPIGVMAEYVRSVQNVALGDTHGTTRFEAYQALAQWVVTGDDATYKSVAPKHPFDPSKGDIGAIDIAARFTELRAVDTDAFAAGFLDANKSAKRAYSATFGADWFLTRAYRLALDIDHTWFKRGAATDGDRPAETSIIGRVQAVF